MTYRIVRDGNGEFKIQEYNIYSDKWITIPKMFYSLAEAEEGAKSIKFYDEYLKRKNQIEVVKIID